MYSSHSVILCEILHWHPRLSWYTCQWRADINNQNAITYQLPNSTTCFEKICAHIETRKWLEKYLAKGTVSMVIGLHTVRDASVNVHRETSPQFRMQFSDTEMRTGGHQSSIPMHPSLRPMNGSSQCNIGGSTSKYFPPKMSIMPSYKNRIAGNYTALSEETVRWKPN